MTDDEILEDMAALSSAEAKAEFQKWLAERPQTVRDLAAKCPHEVPYRVARASCAHLPIGTIVGICAYREDGTVRVLVLRGEGIGVSHLVEPDVLERYQIAGMH